MDLIQLEKVLYTYCVSNQKSFDDFVKENKLSQLLPSIVSLNNSSQHIMRMLQNIRNKAFFQCMHELKSVCEGLGIKYAFIKGLILADDLYNPREARSYSDIDILVSLHDVAELLTILAQRGYMNEEKRPPSAANALKRIENGHHHLTAIHKSFMVGANSINVAIEIHVSPIAAGFRFQGEIKSDFTYTEAVLSRTTPRIIDGECFQTPAITDTLYILAMHLTAHACLDTILYLFLCKPFTLSPVLKMTIDIALFLDKYSDAINWEQLANIADRYNTGEMLSLVFYLIHEIYGIQSCPNNFFNQVHSRPNAYSEVCRLLKMIPYKEYANHSHIKNRVDAIVKKNAFIRGDSLPVGAVIGRRDNNLQIQLLKPCCEALYCVDIYNTDTEIDGICREYLLEIAKGKIKVYHDNGYRIFWDPMLCKHYGFNDIMLCYDESNATIYMDKRYVTITIKDEEIGFDSNQVSVQVMEINKANPLLTKHFI